MRDWLPDNWKNDAISKSTQRSAEAVAHRVVRHRKTVRAARWTGVAVILVAAVFVLAPRLDRHAPVDGGRQVARRGSVQQEKAPLAGRLPQQASVHQDEAAQPASHRMPVDVQVARHDRDVVLSWKGNPAQEYVVYRCTSPRFDTCSTAGVVRGDRWVDSEPTQAPIVFYKVEARKGA